MDYRRIPLGTYTIEDARKIREAFNKARNRYKQRDPKRLRAHILFRGRGKRNLYKKRGNQYIPVCNNLYKELKVHQSQKVAIYLLIRR